MTRIGAVFRASHVVLHIAVIGLIVIGILSGPMKIGGGDVTFLRTVVWMAWEGIILFIAVNILVFTLYVRSVYHFSQKVRKLPTLYEKVHDKISRHPNDVNIFFYTTMSMFVLYGAMLGCHIPDLFQNNTMDYRLCLIGAILFSAVNAILYFLTAFCPIIASWSDESNDQQNLPDDLGPSGEAMNSDVNLIMEGEVAQTSNSTDAKQNAVRLSKDPPLSQENDTGTGDVPAEVTEIKPAEGAKLGKKKSKRSKKGN